MNRKTFDSPCEIKGLDDAGHFTAYGSVFDVKDSAADVVMPGAFVNSLKRKMPSMLWQHDTRSPIGIYHKAEEDKHGLRLEGELILDTQQGREAHALMKKGAVTGFSIGYQTVQEEFNKEAGVNLLKEVDLWEVSLVTFPCNDEARLSDIKAAFVQGRLPTEREFERFLRDEGYSNKQARKIVSGGYLAFLRDEGEADPKADLSDQLRRILS